MGNSLRKVWMLGGREIQHFSPVLVQNRVETDLKKVEHIKLAKPKRSL